MVQSDDAGKLIKNVVRRFHRMLGVPERSYSCFEAAKCSP
jgi:hypothetical protein